MASVPTGSAHASATTATLIDISVPLRADTPVFEGNPPISLSLQQSLRAGDEANVSSLSLGVHSGTHVDAPYHFFDSGGSAEGLSLSTLIGEATVVDGTGVEGHFDRQKLSSLPLPPGCRRLLVKTGNSDFWSSSQFRRDFQGLTADGASYLVEKGLLLIGWDYLSVGPFGDAVETHRVLLDAGVVILEGIDLRKVSPGDYELLCLPLFLHGSDGTPARAVLRTRGTRGG